LTVDTFKVGGASLEYEASGRGEAVLLVHGAIVADSFAPMLDRSDLRAKYQVITYHRRGFCGSAPASDGRTLSDDATDVVALLDHLGVAKAHVVGHSYGGALALQLALDSPDRVHSLGLLEPPVLSVPSAEGFFAGVGPVVEKFQAGDHPGALLAFLELVGGPDPMSRLGALPEASQAQALSDLPTLFGGDLPTLGSWQFDEPSARKIHQPALAVLGSDSATFFAESIRALEEWLPATESFTLGGASHFLQMNKPSEMGSALGSFLSRHPVRRLTPLAGHLLTRSHPRHPGPCTSRGLRCDTSGRFTE
jgi:pimeloyl-ACP methyl ester carboxylesterase